MAGTPPSSRDVMIGAKLRECRKAAGLTKAELGRLLGVSHVQYGKYESGANHISAGHLYKLSLRFGVPMEAFFEGRPDTSDDPSVIA